MTNIIQHTYLESVGRRSKNIYHENIKQRMPGKSCDMKGAALHGKQVIAITGHCL